MMASIMDYMTCPVCNGEQMVWYEGSLEGYVDDPGGWVRCPSCNDGRVLKSWGASFKGNKEELCAFCGVFAPCIKVVDLEAPIDILYLVWCCHDCYEERHHYGIN